jgi:uncharacterized membrane protein YccC
MVERLGFWLRRPQPELSLGLCSTVAGLITFALGHVLGLPQIYWAVLAAIIVLTLSYITYLLVRVRLLGGDRFCW